MAEHSGNGGADGRSNRRSENRHLSCIPASVRRDRPGLALVRNISVHGALIFTRSTLVVGERLHLSLHFVDDGPGVPVEATVVRVLPTSRRDVWRFEVGVEFSAPLTEYTDQIVALEAKQNRLGLTKT